MPLVLASSNDMHMCIPGCLLLTMLREVQPAEAVDRQ